MATYSERIPIPELSLNKENYGIWRTKVIAYFNVKDWSIHILKEPPPPPPSEISLVSTAESGENPRDVTDPSPDPTLTSVLLKKLKEAYNKYYKEEPHAQGALILTLGASELQYVDPEKMSRYLEENGGKTSTAPLFVFDK